MVQVPEEFGRFTRCFLQGSLEEAKNEIDWIDGALKLSNPAQRSVIKLFLDQILTDCDGSALQRIWSSGAPAYGIANDDELRDFLKLVRDSIK